MNVIINGSISNSFQLIGAIAAKNRISENLNTKVYLKIGYHQYWNKENIPRGVLELIENEFLSTPEIEHPKEIHLSINNPIFLKKNQIIVDDGVGAYRKNPFALLKAIKKERIFNNKDPLSVIASIKYILTQSTTMFYSTFHPGHISIFKKKPWNYFEPNKENKKHFLKAIEQISNHLNVKNSEKFKEIILFISQPHNLIGFNNAIDYKIFMEKVLLHFQSENPEATFVIKKHPIDSFDYSSIEARISSDNGILPAEIYFYHNKEKILKTIGFSSTSLLTGKVLFDIPGFYIERHEDISVTGDFWADRGFKIHLNPLRLHF